MKEVDKYVDIKWVVEYTGLSKSMVYQLANPEVTPREHLLPSYVPVNKKLFKVSEVERWMQRHKAS